MKKPKVFSIPKYLDNIINSIDSKNSEKFLDSTILSNSPILYYDQENRTYAPNNINLTIESMHYFYFEKDYNKIKQYLLQNINDFQKYILEFIKKDFRIPIEVHNELSKLVNYDRKKLRNNKQKIQNMNTYREVYITDFEKSKRIIKRGKKYDSYKINKEKEIYSFIDKTLQINSRTTKKIKKSLRTDVNNLTNLKLQNENLYTQIFSVVQNAFKKYQEYCREIYEQNHKNYYDATKDQNKSRDKEILSELILYSHLMNKNVIFYTGDHDFYSVTYFLEHEKIDLDLNSKVRIVQRINNSKKAKIPIFKLRADIEYSDKFSITRY